MDLRALRARLNKLAREMPAVVSGPSATQRFADLLGRIEAEEGPRRTLSVYLMVSAAQYEEPEDFAALLAALGPERIAEAFPDGNVPQVCPNADLRARARAYEPGPGDVNPLVIMLEAAIKKRDMAEAQTVVEPLQ